MDLFIGTYSSHNKNGLYRLDFDEKLGFFKDLQLLSDVENSKYIHYQDDLVYSLLTQEDLAGVAIIDKCGNLVDKILFEPIASCFIAVIDSYIYTLNYHLGTITQLKFDDKLEVLQTHLVKSKAGLHQIVGINNKLYVPCLLLDCIQVFDNNLNYITEIKFEQGTGPRHFVVSGDYLYVVGELCNKLYCVDLNTYEIVTEICLLLDGETNITGSCAIKMNKDGNLLYVSTRIKNVISIIKIDGCKMSLEKVFSSFGNSPKDLQLFDEYLVVANQDSNEVCAISLQDFSLINKITINECATLAKGEM